MPAGVHGNLLTSVFCLITAMRCQQAPLKRPTRSARTRAARVVKVIGTSADVRHVGAVMSHSSRYRSFSIAIRSCTQPRATRHSAKAEIIGVERDAPSREKRSGECRKSAAPIKQLPSQGGRGGAAASAFQETIGPRIKFLKYARA